MKNIFIILALFIATQTLFAQNDSFKSQCKFQHGVSLNFTVLMNGDGYLFFQKLEYSITKVKNTAKIGLIYNVFPDGDILNTGKGLELSYYYTPNPENKILKMHLFVDVAYLNYKEDGVLNSVNDINIFTTKAGYSSTIKVGKHLNIDINIGNGITNNLFNNKKLSYCFIIGGGLKWIF